MANTYYARATVRGTTTPQSVQVQAGSSSEAKKLIEARLGKVKHWNNSPVPAPKPPSWFRN